MAEPMTPRTADDYLREAMGGLIAQLLVQTAVLRAEVDQLHAELARLREKSTPTVEHSG